MKRWVSGLMVLAMVMGLARAASAQKGGRALPRANTALRTQPVPAPAGSLPLLPRFWHLADSAERTDAAEIFQQFLRQFIQYPVLALKAGVGGVIYAMLTVLPDGRVSSISVTRRALTSGAPPIKAVLALDAELLRVAWQLRFKPMLVRPDSAASAAAVDVTDVPERSDNANETESDDSIDVTEAPAATSIPADTVTIHFQFAPQ
ncbi:energy transducer TonB [Hymenobacter armeniacus]|uniref:TonB C-terminal domain-containing protein n=1 Tax=Hymenobacter armeniacus TaxID=2771358 RepID=A0ABR8JMJ8_9BACT|nr:hypothetical protein [Hymenobacter armeniacus]MBD2721230.1 hypothetical protein [Hymenobacter armeniacus]